MSTDFMLRPCFNHRKYLVYGSTRGVFQARDQPCIQVFQRPLINEWSRTRADHIPAPVVSNRTRVALISAVSGRRESLLLTFRAAQLKFSHKPQPRVLLPHRRSLFGIPGYWVSSRYNAPTNGERSDLAPCCQFIFGGTTVSDCGREGTPLLLQPVRHLPPWNRILPGTNARQDLRSLPLRWFRLSSTEVACAKEAWAKEKPPKISVIFLRALKFCGDGWGCVVA